MWEAIRSNQRKSTVLIWVMGFVLAILGYAIGMFYGGNEAGLFGVIAAIVLWIILLFTAMSGGKQIVLASTGARKIMKEDHPKLFNIVEEMSIASGLGKVPEIYVIEDDSPNAFATGLDKDQAAVAVTTGLLKRLSRDELQGVIAHEIGHVTNMDIRFMTIAAVTMGAIVLLADVFFRSLRYMGMGRRRSSGKGAGQAQLIILLIALVLAILAPIVAQILYFACSRKREYLADASSARFTRYPEGLASALEKISGGPKMTKGVNRAVAPMFIVNPLKGLSAASLFATHPPIDKRVKILRSLGGNSGYSAYESAFKQVEGKGSHLIGAMSLAGAEAVEVREAIHEEIEMKEEVERSKEVIDMLDKVAGYSAIPCVCGLNIHVPPGYERDVIKCPRCGLSYPVPK
jgi:heat shock protein HtpX